ncbi:MAG TPA: hypothetical protein G4O12_01920 [Dehalococcoidia bacterium]|nr:hypothetical protein [Dehalococcoidia bacterium]
MEILPHRYYTMIMRSGEHERVGKCFNLAIQELSPEESQDYETPQPTNVLVFHDTQNLRTYTGWIKENLENRLVFKLAEGKEYEFRPIVAPRPT